ncbi:MAG TPA: hypothetical protein VI796_00545, partial [Candidatus Thermoplasmatota archaeon]|nr:hypothetical protein [Candidatus Thermoplasmatota archaeon]
SIGAAGSLAAPGAASEWALLGAALLLVVTGMFQLRALFGVLPPRGISLVDLERDPLTKGDDASLKHVRLAHIFLPAGLAILAAAAWPGLGATPMERLRLAGLHVLLVGYGVLSLYGLGHLVVPRYSGVPAIAAGAIKGELHSSLAAIVLLAAGFLSGVMGLVVAGGAFAFLGVFTYMGVLGANIMRNKSRTQQVTPEFTYVPWTFSAVFWLVSGVLLGIFLNAVPDAYAARLPALRFTHVHALLLGGFAQLILGFAQRAIPAEAGRPPPRFSTGRWGFYLLNAGLVILILGALADRDGAFRAGALMAALAFAVSFMSLARHLRAGRPSP